MLIEISAREHYYIQYSLCTWCEALRFSTKAGSLLSYGKNFPLYLSWNLIDA